MSKESNLLGVLRMPPEPITGYLHKICQSSSNSKMGMTKSKICVVRSGFTCFEVIIFGNIDQVSEFIHDVVLLTF